MDTTYDIEKISHLIANHHGLFGVFANPGFGTTTLLLQLTHQSTKQKGGTAVFFSLEASKEYLLNRMSHIGLSIENIIIDDTPSPPLRYITDVIENTESLSLIVIDYLQLLDENVAGKLKNISQKYCIPILIGGHLPRNSGDFDSKHRPDMYCLTFIKQHDYLHMRDYDMLLLLHRDHDLERGIGTVNRYNISNECELIMKINRFGELDNFRLLM